MDSTRLKVFCNYAAEKIRVGVGHCFSFRAMGRLSDMLLGSHPRRGDDVGVLMAYPVRWTIRGIADIQRWTRRTSQRYGARKDDCYNNNCNLWMIYSLGIITFVIIRAGKSCLFTESLGGLKRESIPP